MIDKDIKAKLDERLINGEIDTEEYNRIFKLLSQNGKKEYLHSSSQNHIHRTSNKKIIWFSIAVLIIYGIFATYQDIKAREKLEQERMLQYDIERAIQKGTFNIP